jgi:hypothetical protein
MSLNSLLNVTVDIQTQAASKSMFGGDNSGTNYTAKASGVRARVSQLAADVIEAYGRLGYQVSHRVYFDTDQNLSVKDRIVFEGKAYEVRSINNAGGHLDRLWHVDVLRLPLGD